MSSKALLKKVMMLERVLSANEELEQKVPEWKERAWESLTEDQMKLFQDAYSIYEEATQKAEAWINQPEEVKRKSPFYEEYLILSPICKKGHVAWEFMNEEEKQVLTDASNLEIALRRKFDPTFGIRGKMH